MIKGKEVFINGDGKTTRDFCFIENTVQMNILQRLLMKAQKMRYIMLLLEIEQV